MTRSLVVTGCARTGTSLTMQTLAFLGMSVVGYRWHPEFYDRELHPKGCYDLPMAETMGGIHGQTYDGKAIKLFAYQLCQSSPESIDGVIVCQREKDPTLLSLVKLLESHENKYGIPATTEIASIVYEYSYGLIHEYLERHRKRSIVVSFEQFVADPGPVVGNIADFVGWNGSLSEAIANVIVRRPSCLSDRLRGSLPV